MLQKLGVHHLLIFFSFSVLPAFAFAADDLASYVPSHKPSWEPLEANSDRNNPLYLGAKPRDMALFAEAQARPRLPDFMKGLLQAQTKILIDHFSLQDAEIEAWPVENDEGDYTWAFARYRELGAQSSKSWIWLRAKELEGQWTSVATLPELPVTKNLSSDQSFNDVFMDFLEFKDLYKKPLFGNAIFTDGNGQVLAAWLSTDSRETMRDRFLKRQASRKNIVARILSQPARLNDQPVTFFLQVQSGRLQIPSDIDFKPSSKSLSPSKTKLSVAGLSFSDSWTARYKEEVEICAGEKVASFPISGKSLLFTKKNNAQEDNQLFDNAAEKDTDRLDMATYLKEKYLSLGVKIWEQKFEWRGQTHSNVIAVIPGSLQKSQNRPVVIADHFDTAFEEDTFRKSNRRVSAKGADDNCTATAGLLAAAEILKATQPKHDIWLVHLTGEEFPADDLGVRQLLPYLLKRKIDVQAFMIMDMIGFNKNRGKIFQISAGESAESLQLAKLAADTAANLAPNKIAKLRDRFDLESYLYNTDGRVVSAIGYPVILFNEHLNRGVGIDREGYHDTNDTSKNIDWNYAVDILKVVIGTANSLGQN